MHSVLSEHVLGRCQLLETACGRTPAIVGEPLYLAVSPSLYARPRVSVDGWVNPGALLHEIAAASACVSR
eukprot:1162584-Pleurochrysis_carterae.AAC.2